MIIDPALKNLALYGYGVFTTFLMTERGIRGLALHVARLQDNCNQLFSIIPTKQDILNEIQIFLKREKPDLPTVIRITIYSPDLSIANPNKISKIKFLIGSRPCPSDSSNRIMRLLTVESLRSLPKIKTTNLASNLYARKKAIQQNFDDALMVNKNRLLEGPTWNVFFIRNNVLYSPSTNEGILPGITRQIIMDLAATNNIPLKTSLILESDLPDFDFGFITNAVIGLLPISSINQISFSSKNTLYMRILDLYNSLLPEPLFST